MNNYILIMAGGGGTRFWPLSKQNLPKQLLNLSGNDIMINETIKRCRETIPPEHIFIITNENQAETMKPLLLDEIPKENIIIEPMSKNTSACILYASLYINKKFGEGVLCVLPSDHHISDEIGFIKVLNESISFSEKNNNVLTIGIKPTFAATGYGYIKKSSQRHEEFLDIFPVNNFIEKPKFEKAQEYYKSNDFYWNSGIFIWKLSLIFELFNRFLPRIFKEFINIKDSIDNTINDELVQVYQNIDSISVDYGIMERLDDAFVIHGDFGWNDLGSWDQLAAISSIDENGNIIKSDHIGIATKECIIYGDKRLITTVGLNNMVIVDTDEAILICRKDRCQDVKYIVEMLKEQGRTDLI